MRSDRCSRLGFMPTLVKDPLGLEPSGEYRALEHSRLIEPGPTELAERLDWPPPAS